MIAKTFPILVLSLLLLSAAGCDRMAQPYTRSGFALDTVIGITVYDTEKSHAESVLDKAYALCGSYEKLFGISDPQSDVYRLNHADGEKVKVSDDTYALLKQSVTYAEISGGLLDVTIQPLYALWDFQNETHENIPDDTLLQEAAAKVDYRNIEFYPDNEIALSSGAQVNLGAVAKGYIADRIKEFLLREGISSALINLGGNIQTIGTKPDGSPFRIGLQTPFDDTGAVLAEVDVNDRSVVTSGTYQRYFTLNGTNYHHILDPYTGYPAENGLNAAVVITDSSVDADAYSTICMLLGYDKACDLISSLDQTEAYLIDRANVIHHVD